METKSHLKDNFSFAIREGTINFDRSSKGIKVSSSRNTLLDMIISSSSFNIIVLKINSTLFSKWYL
ncbi:hypothetical protein RND71_016634 [Anisodus tanguticus]|uniref:Uncharacterized protein n=1 Tax=Anisodus tanguticus TaxID=243964 RepID=A0AAE1VIR5_9SOLA|nr:hypothetical protein RND71_016634 [Anisodus tanguticus]